MQEFIVHVEKREIKSKSYLKGLRREGRIPGVYYGHGKKPTPVSVDISELHRILTEDANLFSLDFGTGRKRRAIIREIQFDPITDEILHVDFMGIKAGEKITVHIPINLVGTPVGVKDEGGVLEFAHREVEIECLPKDMPTSIDLDISNMHVHDTLHVKDIQIENATILTDGEVSIVHVLPPRLEAAAARAEVEEAEGEAPEKAPEETTEQ